ncbi:MAG: adenosylcobinamide-phosphate synthase CbiB [Candidatus Polarisedimenticolaceae bacterium]|nr:adenosylcobinamide-phosphate synthase CbiB [Candidatus Polarisedimenticolaceae bacterium]
MITALTVSFALLLDSLLGEPRRWHPLVGFGWLADKMEKSVNQPESGSRLAGLVALLILITPFILIAALLDNQSPFIGLLLLYLALGGRSLIEHAQQIATSLKQGDLERSRRQVGWIVSRETGEMQSSDVARATIESILENGSDAIFGALFWFLVAGAPGVVGYRLVNTLDAMWGYRSSRFQHFGWAAARLDDLLNLAPARLTALTYALVGSFQQAIRCWSQQAAHWDSPNAGPVMAAGAGALNIRLGGAAIYHGKTHQRPILGCGSEPDVADIERAIKLVQNSLLLWVIVIVTGGWFLA